MAMGQRKPAATRTAPAAPSKRGTTAPAAITTAAQAAAAENEQADSLGGFPEEVCPVMVRWGDSEDLQAVTEDDFVVVVKGARKSAGIKSKSGKDTRILATTPGMFSWLTDVAHETGRRLGVKLTLMLSKPIKVRADGTEDEADRDTTMSALV